MRGCDADAPNPPIPSMTTLRCPRAVVDTGVMWWLDAFARWELLGVLPFQGSFDEQPAMVEDAFYALKSAQAEGQKRALDELRVQRSRQG